MEMVAAMNRDTAVYEAAVSHVFGLPFADVVRETAEHCEVADLHQLGRRLLLDLVRLARGEISSIVVPARAPYRGEHNATN